MPYLKGRSVTEIEYAGADEENRHPLDADCNRSHKDAAKGLLIPGRFVSCRMFVCAVVYYLLLL